MSEYSRTADDAIYLVEDRYAEPKESFKEIAELLGLRNGAGALVDIGCATGEFLHFVRSLNPALELFGVEYSPALVAHANQRLADQRIRVVEGDANRLPLPDRSFDYVTTIGVTSIFDDFRPSFDEMVRVARPGAKCVNHMVLNPDGVDFLIKYVKDGVLESGWNRFAPDSVCRHLERKPGVTNVRFVKHVMPFDIPRRDDPMRSWTRMLNGERVLWNGLGMEVALFHVLFDIADV